MSNSGAHLSSEIPPPCGKCGSPRLAESLGGLCPRCLLAEGLPGPDGSGKSDTHRFRNPLFQRSFGDYELQEEIARGGMGIIYKARQRSLGRIVAIKVLLSGEFASPEFVQRFRTEAAAAARLQHPNIVAIHEVGEIDGARYFSMDYVEGPNLAQHLNGLPLPARRAAGYLGTIADAVHYAHQQGLLHRVLKPSNVLIDPFGEPRLTDFGLAKELAGDSDLTVTGQILGTPGFLAPEQADPAAGPLTQAADLYSLGAILYYMLTTRPPFAAGSLPETLRQVLTCDPVAPRLLNPEVPTDLATICLKCLEREPGRRYESAAALRDDLRRFLDGEPIVARPPSPLGRAVRWCRRRPAIATIWILVATLAAGSTTAVFGISRARRNAESALAQMRAAEVIGRERLREARLAQARAVRRTTLPGRRAQALSALAEAATIRPGPDLRNEALASLMVPDISAEPAWSPPFGLPGTVSVDNAARVVAYEAHNALGSRRGSAQLWQWGASTPFLPLNAEGAGFVVGPLRFSPAGDRLLARYANESLLLWMTGQPEPALRLPHQSLPDPRTLTRGFNTDYDFSPDGGEFAVGIAPRGVAVYRSSNGLERGRWEGGERFNCVRYSPDGRYLAGLRNSSYEVRKLYVLRTGDLGLEVEINFLQAPSMFAWSADSRLLAVSTSDRMVSLYDLPRHRFVSHLPCPGLGPGELTFVGSEGWLAVRGSGTTLRVLSPALGQEELVLDSFGASDIATVPGSNSFVTAAVEGGLIRWQLQPPVGFRVLPPTLPDLAAATFNANCFDFSPDGRWVASTHGRFTLLRDVLTGHLVDDADAGEPPGVNFETVTFSDDGRALVRCSSLFGVRRQRLRFDAEGQPHFDALTTLDAETGFFLTDHSPDGTQLALVAPELGRVKWLKLQGGQIVKQRTWDLPDAYCAALDPQGGRLLVNGGGATTNPAAQYLPLLPTDLDTPPEKLPARPFGEASWSADGRVVLTSHDAEHSRIWDTRTWTVRAELTGPVGGNITTFTLSPDGESAVIARDESIYLVSTRDGHITASWESPGASGLAAGIRFLPDHRQFAVLWRDGRIDLFDPAALRQGLRTVGLAW